MKKQSGRALHRLIERDPDPRYPKPKGDSKQIGNQCLRRFLKKDLANQSKQQ